MGTDSHVGIDPLLELQLLEYGQRLKHQKRNVLCQKEGDQSGQILYDSVIKHSASTMGAIRLDIHIGVPLSVVVYPDTFPVSQVPEGHRLSAFIFSGEPFSPLGIQHRNRWTSFE